MDQKPLRIFVHYASEFLTDFQAHGDGLICFSLLNGLAERGHHIFAYTSNSALRDPSPRLTVRVESCKLPSSALATWEHAWRANRWFAELNAVEPVDLVWRMHPYGARCPITPRTDGRPLVIGPMFYAWPTSANEPRAHHRFGIGIWPLLKPLAEKGWRTALHEASLLICATPAHARAMQAEFPATRVMDLPVIVERAEQRSGAASVPSGAPLTLAFTGNLVENKRPAVFLEIIGGLHAANIRARGLMIGDGPLRRDLEKQAALAGLSEAVTFAGAVPNSRVYELVAAADFLISTSIGEPYGRGIVEAMAVGTPAVCHRSGGPADLIEDGIDGILVERNEAAAYVDRLKPFRAGGDLWGAMSKNSLRKAIEWRSEAVLSRLESAFREVISSKSLG